MTEANKIAHLLRRFGFGAGTLEFEKYRLLGYSGTLDALLNYSAVPDTFITPPWQFVFNKENQDVNLDPEIIAQWWSLRMLLTERPLEQKLTLFWHNLLVVGADKVDFGGMTVDYLETIRSRAGGPFGQLLAAVSKTPAMVQYLDSESSIRSMENENFAREVMELFTLGIGNYTELDVKEAARAFSGWWNRHLIYEEIGSKDYNKRVRFFIKNGIPMVAFCWMPQAHDGSAKTILGTTKNFTGEEVLALLAARPETARRIGKRLFEFFAYDNPAEAVIEKMAASFTHRHGNTIAVLKDLAEMEEFWSPKCVRQLIKSPADFLIPIMRQTNVASILRHQANPQPLLPIGEPLRKSGEYVCDNLDELGLHLLHPPNVKGWDWGPAWISPNTMIQRTRFSDVFYDTVGGTHVGEFVAKELLALRPANDAELVEHFLARFDAAVPNHKVPILVEACQSSGGLKALEKKDSSADCLASMGKFLFGSPEFQFC